MSLGKYNKLLQVHISNGGESQFTYHRVGAIDISPTGGVFLYCNHDSFPIHLEVGDRIWIEADEKGPWNHKRED